MKHLNIVNLVLPLKTKPMYPILFRSFGSLVTSYQDPCALNVDQECLFLFVLPPISETGFQFSNTPRFSGVLTWRPRFMTIHGFV